MVSGTPPRHSKSADEPVTIDLDSQEFASVADTEKPVDTDAGEADSAVADADLPPETEATSEPEQESHPRSGGSGGDAGGRRAFVAPP